MNRLESLCNIACFSSEPGYVTMNIIYILWWAELLFVIYWIAKETWKNIHNDGFSVVRMCLLGTTGIRV